MTRHSTRREYDNTVRLSLLEDDADRHEDEVASIKRAMQRLTYSITGATLTLVVGIILWALDNKVLS